MTSNNIRYNVETEFLEIDSKGAWPILYQHIRSECLNYEYTVQEARKTHNKNLNRYRDVSPYDHSRIVLSKGPCDYINASLVTIGKANRRYILTQGPLSHTTGHFWLMVWEQNCKAVLMLNRIIEKKQEKCHQYWPLATRCGVDDEMVLKEVGLKIQFISEKCASYYTTRTLRLTEIESGNSRDILHFHYTTWPDFGVPQSPTAFLEFLMVVRRSGVLSPNVGPPVVHCSAGIGRSGTFCLVDSCLVLRKQEERRERRERLASQVREMKRKQEESESWQKWKKSIFTPLNLGVGVGILLIGGGVMAYMCKYKCNTLRICIQPQKLFLSSIANVFSSTMNKSEHVVPKNLLEVAFNKYTDKNLQFLTLSPLCTISQQKTSILASVLMHHDQTPLFTIDRVTKNVMLEK
ncbi:Tyrosine-protein phosphatase non-receptor type 61F [Gryllus bimaculatus]|nr:Tyrosine-protein phosphatase non-receptor type 61F [Gryllus bimaculatus]